jgi:hypothetical protein
LAYRLVLNNKIIWDNVEFECILPDGLYDDPKNYLPPSAINNDVISIGGWRINVQSTIHVDAKAFEVINAFNQVQTKMNSNICDTQDGCPHNDDAQTYCLSSTQVTNTTACTDGYVNGREHWCVGNAKYCVELMLTDGLQSANLNGWPIFVNENKTLLADVAQMSKLQGTANESSGAMSNMSMDDMNNMNGTSAKITFNPFEFNEYISKNITESGDWTTDGHIRILYVSSNATSAGGITYTKPHNVDLTFTTKSPNHMELQDSHGDIIHLRR